MAFFRNIILHTCRSKASAVHLIEETLPRFSVSGIPREACVLPPHLSISNSVCLPIAFPQNTSKQRDKILALSLPVSKFFPKCFNSTPLPIKLSEERKNPETDLEISKEAKALFENCWDDVMKEFGLQNVKIPKEIVWLNGAPGAGKGANTPFILKTRGFHAKSIQVSDLIQNEPEAKEIMASGGLVSDKMVFKLLLQTILNLDKVDPPSSDADHGDNFIGFDSQAAVSGAVVDGFPRTTLQVDLVKLFYDKLTEIHNEHIDTPSESKFPRPIFRIAVLYVEEEESVRRQLARGKAAIAHNERVSDSGVGSQREVRATDLSEISARRRYQIFREHYGTLLRLRTFFPFHLIDGMGTLSECREQIEKELQYQSALELDATTFRAISHIPLSSDLAKFAKQSMVTRLDNYNKHQHDVFTQVVGVISDEVVPIIRRCALSGLAVFTTTQKLFEEKPVACEMLADVLSERGYAVTWQKLVREIPARINPETYEIICRPKVVFEFQVRFERPTLRSSSSLSLSEILQH